jgi:type II secretory pathway predicted ATPase ExeA
VEHLKRFGLAREPFRNEPQLEFWFESTEAAEARQRLLRCLRQRKELCVLVGEVGSGTTSLARMVLEDLEPDRFEAALLVVGRGVEPAWLRAAVARQLGVDEPAAGRAEAMRQLYTRLVAIREEGRHAVVVIDEAQALAGSDALADLVALLNFEHEDSRLLTAVLVGAPELERALSREPALHGRVELRVRLAALDREEARAYLAHRVQVAGGDPAVFPAEVADAIAERASGLPRRMNALADNTLFEAHVARRPVPTVGDVDRAADDLPWAQGTADTVSGLGPALSLDLEIDKPPARRVDPNEDTLDRRTREAARAALSSYDVPDLDTGAAASAARPTGRVARFELDQTLQSEELDVEVMTPRTPGETEPGAWRTAQAAGSEDDTTGSRRPLAEEDEIEDLFVDLVDEEPPPAKKRR